MDDWPDDIRCVATVVEPPHYIHNHRCRRRGVVHVQEFLLCRQHYQVAKKNRFIWIFTGLRSHSTVWFPPKEQNEEVIT